MPFWSFRNWGAVVVTSGAGAAFADRDGGGESGSGSPLRAHVRWICQLVSENRARSYTKKKTYFKNCSICVKHSVKPAKYSDFRKFLTLLFRQSAITTYNTFIQPLQIK